MWLFCLFFLCFSIYSRIRKAFKCHCGKSYKTSLKLRNHTLLIHNGGGSTSDLSISSSSLSSLNSTQQLSDSASPPLAITLKNSINLVAIKTSKASNGIASSPSLAGTSKVNNKDSGKSGNGGDATNNHNNTNKIPKLTPMKGYDALGILDILTPATSPKNQQQQQQQHQHQQHLLNESNHMLNGSSSSVEILTPVSPAASPSSSTTSTTSYQQMKKTDS